MEIILTAIASSGLFAFVQFLIKRHDDKKGRNANIDHKLEEFEKQLKRCERDNCRTQMLLLMSDYPEDKAEIMRLAEHYFHDLQGNWYMTGMFNRWLIANNIGKPEWFDSEA